MEGPMLDRRVIVVRVHGGEPNFRGKIMQSPRVSLINFLAAMNVHRAQMREMLKKFDELYPQQAEELEPEDKLYTRLADPI
jgi:hypothetical protein